MEFHAESFIKVLFLSVISASVGLYTSAYFIKRWKFSLEYNKLKVLREARILQKKLNLEKFQEYLDKSNTQTEITNKSFSELIEILKSDKISKDEVIYAYQKKAFEVNSKLNCVVDFLHVDKSEINFNGPLSGLPISLKDNFCVKNYTSYAGCSYFLDKPSTVNSVLVEVIKDLGGVPFVKTSVPQTMMSFLSSNPIDGITLNPIDLSKSPGGSSSGEAALIGGHGSIVGLGTDIGGSVRLPAAFCGIVGFKPTYGRLSKKGMLSLSKDVLISGSCGILGRDVESIAYLFEHIVNSSLHRTLDPTIVPLDFRNNIFQSNHKLKIGYFTHNESHRCVPAVKRAVLETLEILKNNGHELVHWQPPITGEEWLTLFLTAIAANGGKDLLKICQHDEKDFTIKNLLNMFNLNYLQYIFKMLEASLKGNKEAIIWLKASRGLSSGISVVETIEKIRHLREIFISDWERLGLDMIICPTAGFVAPPVKPSGSLTGMLSYQNIWNLVDFPAGTVPVSKVNKTDIDNLHSSYPKDLSPWHANTFNSQTDSLNMPVSVQCVTRPWNEELCLRVMKEIQISFPQ